MKPLPELLIVDDNPADVVLAREALTGSVHGSQISSVEDGDEAMAFLNHRGR
jgi:CheY-like chemotaxis protein